MDKIVKCGNLKISNKGPFTLIAGPCQLENEKHALTIANELKKIETSWNKLNDDYLKNERVMSKDERKNKIDEINKVEKEFRTKQQTLQQELQSKQNSELNRIRVIVENAINEYAKDNDYDLILRADGTTLYAKTYVDITQEIIEKLN